MAGDNDKDDLALFRDAMEREGVRKAKPRSNTIAPEKLKHTRLLKVRKQPATRRPEEVREDPASAAVTTSELDQTQPGEPILFVRSGVEKSKVRQLKRHQMVVDECVDLHGMRENEAARALARFLDECKFFGWKCVQIIHGKGRNSEQPGGVLRPLTIHWLKQQPEVIAFCSASDKDGGTGATNVLLAGRHHNP